MHTTSCPPRFADNNKTIAVTVVVCAGLVIAGMLYYLNPATIWFLPPCFFHKMTGWYCPGCGSTRALHCLLHGNLLEALHNNALVILALPLFAAIAIVRSTCRRTETRPRRRWNWIAFAVVVLVVFGVVRNIRRPPYSLLAPATEASHR